MLLYFPPKDHLSVVRLHCVAPQFPRVIINKSIFLFTKLFAKHQLENVQVAAQQRGIEKMTPTSTILQWSRRCHSHSADGPIPRILAIRIDSTIRQGRRQPGPKSAQIYTDTSPPEEDYETGLRKLGAKKDGADTCCHPASRNHSNEITNNQDWRTSNASVINRHMNATGNQGLFQAIKEKGQKRTIQGLIFNAVFFFFISWGGALPFKYCIHTK